MKRRTRPASPRPLRPAPVVSGLEPFFPGIDRLSDVEGFKLLFQVVCLAPPSESDMAHRFLAMFAECRGLEIHQAPDTFRGHDVCRVLKGAEVLFSFSSEVR